MLSSTLAHPPTVAHWASHLPRWLLLDTLTCVMLALILFLGTVIGLFARRHLVGDPRRSYFFRWYAVTLLAVLCLVLAGNLLLLTLAWVATGMGLHQLLLTYGDRPAARLAATKKFVISRLGDLCMLGATAIAIHVAGTADMRALAAWQPPAGGWEALAHTAFCLLIVAAALLKSAQIPFHTWLPDTLETPTPVSALMHAGIINAGGYLVVRLSPVLSSSQTALGLLLVFGTATALVGGLVMLTQTSIKKSLAFSTVAQMGFMMVQCGLGAFAMAALHIVAHGLYKAHAFLGSGNLPPPVVDRPPPRVAHAVAAAALAVTGFVLAYGWIAGFHQSSLGQWVLGSVVVLGISQFLVLNNRSLFTKPGATVLGLAMVVGASAFYAILQRGASWLFAGAVANGAGIAGTLHLLLIIAVGLLFVAAFGFQLFVWQQPAHPALRRIYRHASHAFYFNIRFNRWLQRRQAGTPHGTPGYAPPPNAVDPQAVAAACAKIAPLWPLDHFVAVNPFVGFTDQPVSAAAAYLTRVVNADLLPLADAPALLNQMQDAHLMAARLQLPTADQHLLAAAGVAPTAEALRAALLDRHARRVHAPAVTLFSQFVDQRADGYWHRTFTEDISRRCAALLATDTAGWRAPFRESSLYVSWKSYTAGDPHLDYAGLPGFGAAVRQLPADPLAAIAWAVTTLQIPATAVDDWLYAALFSIRGWAGFCQYQRHNARLNGEDNDNIVSLLAVRLCYEAFLFQSRATPELATAWSATFVSRPSYPLDVVLGELLLSALEQARRSPLLASITRPHVMPPSQAPQLQAVFCIDVRSEVMRRALEQQDAAIQTFGYAGFFGLAVEHRATPHSPARNRCPVLLQPAIQSCGCSTRDSTAYALGKQCKAVHQSLPGCFPSVEIAGLGHLFGLLRDSLARGANRRTGMLAASLDSPPVDGAMVAHAARILAESGLRAPFAPVVVLVGHGSQSANNPHASALDCGACGGHAGDINARLVASLLNDPAVRRALVADHGVDIPATTRFVAALHNTTTEEITVLPAADGTLHKLEPAVAAWLVAAGTAACTERGCLQGLAPVRNSQAVFQRNARDWSQPFPEWGLAGNYALIAARRQRTRHLKLYGQVFMHEYDAARDPDLRVLAMILTAPVIVASWINWQYNASAIDRRHFGSGTKVIHNIAARIGVLAGNGGDIQCGLPLQSLALGERSMHQPSRLHVVLEAEPQAIDTVLAAHASIGSLVRNRWLHVLAWVADGTRMLQRHPDGQWVQVAADGIVATPLASRPVDV
jgi:uncharacterized protein YbcC (UPF0753/DUF2309 family)/NADH:ubiquinone oxidoreductase subunit 5 (subunit L)/multisubunit Na+/H+ antiporter MnhA subunit